VLLWLLDPFHLLYQFSQLPQWQQLLPHLVLVPQCESPEAQDRIFRH
jgi:hypothetical protein